MLLFLIALILLIPLTLLTVMPIGIAFTSLNNLLTLPVQLIGVAFNKRRRHNHALEHATINVLEQHYGRRVPMSGFAQADGFLIHGPAQPNMVLAAAEEGLARLKRGETNLALFPRGSTMIVSGQLIALITFFVTLLALRSVAFSALFIAVVAALLAARFLAKPLGIFLQRALVANLDMHTLHVDHVDARMPENPFALVLSGGQPTQFRVWTQSVEIAPSSEPKRYKAY